MEFSEWPEWQKWAGMTFFWVVVWLGCKWGDNDGE